MLNMLGGHLTTVEDVFIKVSTYKENMDKVKESYKNMQGYTEAQL